MQNLSLGNRNAQHSFASIPNVHLGRSQFDLSRTVKDTFDSDYLNPIFVDEVVPGDTWNVSVSSFCRLATQVRPLMDNMYIDFFFFFVPNRLVWKNWEKFNGAQDNPGDSISFICPYITTGTAFTVGSLFDKYGIPTDVANVPIPNTMPLRAYTKIWNDWFRDENMQNSATIGGALGPWGDGPDSAADFVLQKRGKRHDYFTSCLPWPQKGTAVSMPLGTIAPLKYDTHVSGASTQDGKYALASRSGGVATWHYGNTYGTDAGSTADAVNPLYADLSTATAATINQLRLAFLTQGLLELDARGGTRYVEILRAHFGVVSPDFRLQRAEYLGGGEIKVASHPIAQTAPTAGSNAQGQLAGFGTASVTGGGVGFSKSFVEHGYIIGLCAARADQTYQQGLRRMYSRSTRYDFFWPKLQQLGEQAVLNQEIYCAGNGASGDTLPFGYQERYGEYKNALSEIHGKFRSTYATPLDVWHLAEKFTSLPALGSSFIPSNTPTTRIKAVTTEPDFLGDFWFRCKVARPMMTNAVPATLGRF